MKQAKLSSSTTNELVVQFAEIGVAQYEAILNLDARRYNRLYDEMTLVSQELKQRAGDERKRLTELYRHPNIQVRLKAAIHTLAVYPQEARKVLEEVGSLKGYPPCADARMMLRALDQGTYVPE